MEKQQLLKQLDKEWTAIKESYAGLSDSQLTEPGVMGTWSVKDIREHVGRGGTEVSAAHPHRRQATTIQPVRRHRCFQCTDDGTETGPCALRRREATG